MASLKITPSLQMNDRCLSGVCKIEISSSGLPLTAIKSARAPMTTSPISPSIWKSWAAVSVAERMISAGVSFFLLVNLEEKTYDAQPF